MYEHHTTTDNINYLYQKICITLKFNTMALNTFYRVEDLERLTEDTYWKSDGFLSIIGVTKKGFDERYRLNQLRGVETNWHSDKALTQEEKTPRKGLIFNGRWRVSIILVQGMKFKTCSCPEK